VTVPSQSTFKANGPLTIVDANDNDPQGGYATNGTIRDDFIFTNTGQSSSFSFVASMDATAIMGLDGAFNVTTDQRLNFQPETATKEFSDTLTASDLRDAGTTSKFEAGSINFDDRAACSDANGRFSSCSVTTTDLHFGNSCPRGVDRGTIRSRDQSNLMGNKKMFLNGKLQPVRPGQPVKNGEILI
jgi:hypothetical protein